MTIQPIQQPPSWLGWLFLAIGLAIGAVGAGIIPADESSFNAPHWVVGVCGLVFFASGFRVLTMDRPKISRWSTLVIVASMGVISLWVGLLGKAEAFGGGSSLLSDGTNFSLGRYVFTGAGAGCLVLFAFMLYRWKSLS